MKQKNLLSKLLLLVAVVLMGAGTAWAEEETLTMNTTAGYNELTVTKAGTSSTGGDLEISKGDIVVTSAKGYIKDHEMTIYKSGSMTIGFVDGVSAYITKVILTVANYNFASPEGWTPGGDYQTATKLSSDNTQTFSTTATDKTSFTISNVSGGKTTVKKIVVTYVVTSSEKTDPTITFTDGSVNVGKTLDLSTLFTSNSAGAVTYSITSGSDYASLSGSTLTGVAEGSVSVKAEQAAAGSYNAGEATATITVNAALALSSIAITTPPTTTNYEEGDIFDPAGMVVTATYSDNSTDDVTALCTFSPSTALTIDDAVITVSYTENGVTKTATQAITVEEKIDYATLPFSWAGGSSADLKKVNGVTTYGLGSDYSSTNSPYLVKFDGDGDYIQVKTDGQPGKVTVGVKMLGGANSTSITVQGSADGETFTDVQTLTISGAKNDTLTLKTTNIFAATDRYVRLYFNKGTNGSNVGIGPISIAKPSTDPAIIADATLSLAFDATSGEIGYSIINPVDGVSLTATSEADWISNFVVAADKVTFTTTANTGAERMATVKLTYSTATKDVTVTQAAYVDPNANDGSSIEKAYTVAEAIEVIKALPDNNATTEKYYIKGIVSSFQSTSIVGDGSNYRYFISDDGTTTTELQVFKGKGLNEASFENADDLLVGDTVVIYGPIQYYNGKTPEIAAGNYLVSLIRPVDTTPTITVNPAIVNVSAELQEGTLEISYENLTITGMDDFDIQYYDADGKKIDEPEWIVTDVAEQDPQIGEGYVVSYVIATNRGDARTAYFKVFAAGESDFVYSNKVTINQAKFVETTKYTLATSITSGKHYVIASGTDGAVKVMGAQNNNNRAAVDGTVSGTTLSVVSDAGATEFVVYGPDASGFYTIYDAAKGYLYAASSSSNWLRSQTTNDANGKWSISIDESGKASIKAQGASSNNVMQYNGNNKLFACYGSASQSPVYLYEKDGEATPTETITVTDAKYATYYSENALDFEGTGLTAYIADQKGTKVTFEKITKVPAYTGVLVKADGAGSFTVSSTSSVDDATANDLEGVIAETEYTGSIYVLMNGNKGIGFYKTTQPKFTLNAHTAYLPASIGTSRTFIGLDEATAIDGIVAEKESNGEIYNMSGQRVNSPKKGLYIMDGKKVLVK